MNPEPDDQKDLNHLMLTQYRGGNRDDNKNYQGVPAEADADRGLKIGFSKFAGVIFDAVIAAITALQNALVTILTTIATNISSAATTVSTAISNLSSALVTAINNFSTAMSTAIGLVSTALGTINTTIGGITTALAGVATIATELTAIRKQGQGRRITAGDFATGAGTTVTLGAAYNKINIKVCNRDTAVGDVEIQHTDSGGTVITYLEDNPSFPASTALEYNIVGAASGEKLVFIGPSTMKFGVYGSTE